MITTYNHLGVAHHVYDRACRHNSKENFEKEKPTLMITSNKRLSLESTAGAVHEQLAPSQVQSPPRKVGSQPSSQCCLYWAMVQNFDYSSHLFGFTCHHIFMICYTKSSHIFADVKARLSLYKSMRVGVGISSLYNYSMRPMPPTVRSHFFSSNMAPVHTGSQPRICYLGS